MDVGDGEEDVAVWNREWLGQDKTPRAGQFADIVSGGGDAGEGVEVNEPGNKENIYIYIYMK